MRSVISWLHWSDEAFNVSTMTLEGLSNFPDFIFCVYDSSTIVAVINGAGPIRAESETMKSHPKETLR